MWPICVNWFSPSSKQWLYGHLVVMETVIYGVILTLFWHSYPPLLGPLCRSLECMNFFFLTDLFAEAYLVKGCMGTFVFKKNLLCLNCLNFIFALAWNRILSRKNIFSLGFWSITPLSFSFQCCCCVIWCPSHSDSFVLADFLSLEAFRIFSLSLAFWNFVMMYIFLLL